MIFAKPYFLSTQPQGLHWSRQPLSLPSFEPFRMDWYYVKSTPEREAEQ